ncbi:MAG: division plane positioning ATPase MipZ [Rhodobacteraceae bacterium]|nr:division plane positioning ATPase MipZ [Paracoccaceae bacterium]
MAHVIVLGNEKGGSGKSTTAMHLCAALMAAGKTVGAIDLDLRQRSFFRYLENRAATAKRDAMDLGQPRQYTLYLSDADSLEQAQAEEAERFTQALEMLDQSCDFIMIDCPGSDTRYARMAHSVADTLITPMNDSLVDFDLLARMDAATGKVLGPSVYAEMVWEARQLRASAGLKSVDWVVLRNRLGHNQAHNRRKVGKALENLSKRIGFRIVPGFSERVIFRELFSMGLTLLDLKKSNRLSMSLSNIAARQEVRELIKALNLPEVEVSF